MPYITGSALLVFVLTAGVVGASDAVYDNWKGTLQGRDVTLDGHYYGVAEGRVVLNYRKGQENYVVNLEISGLKPGQEYVLKFLTPEDSGWDRQVVGSFTTDLEGIGHLNVRGFVPTTTDFDEVDAFFSVYEGAWRVATTWGSASEGSGEDIAPVGSKRGK